MTATLAWVMGLISVIEAVSVLPNDSADSSAKNAARILYVDDDAPQSGDGRNWVKAFRHLQDALAKARLPNSDVREIRIAGGVYMPDRGAGIAPGNRHATFELVDGMALRGGFRGRYAGPGNPNQRDFIQFETALSGDLLRNDIDSIWDGPPTWLDNSFHVARANDHNQALVLDGLSIESGNANGSAVNGSGGGLYAPETDLNLVDCRFEWNHMNVYGGGFFAHHATLNLRRCTFRRNLQSDPGSSDGYGGGIYASECDIRIVDSLFTDNEAAHGGAIRADHCSILGDRSAFNWSRENGIFTLDAGPSYFADCDFIGNRSEGSSALFTDGPLTLLRCTVRSNGTNIPGQGAAVVVGGDGPLNVHDCVFLRNYAYYGTWGLSHGDIPVTIANTLFAHNTVSYGLVTEEIAGHLPRRIRNCTYADNLIVKPDDRSDFADGGQGPTLTTYANCIFWNNSPAMFPAGCSIVSNSIVEQPCGGIGNIHADPLFVDAAADDYRLRPGSPAIDAGDNAMLPPDLFDVDGDGNIIEPLPLDLLGLLRFIDHPAAPNTGNPAGLPGITDMGVHEAQP